MVERIPTERESELLLGVAQEMARYFYPSHPAGHYPNP
jgi:hypothetical protein